MTAPIRPEAPTGGQSPGAESNDEFADLEERLSSRFPLLPRSAIESAVNESNHSFDDAPVRTFVPVLVENHARHILQQMGDGRQAMRRQRSSESTAAAGRR